MQDETYLRIVHPTLACNFKSLFCIRKCPMQVSDESVPHASVENNKLLLVHAGQSSITDAILSNQSGRLSRSIRLKKLAAA